MTAPRIRRATAADLAALVALDAALFATDAWSRRALADEIADELADQSGGESADERGVRLPADLAHDHHAPDDHAPDDRACLVADRCGMILGYAVLRLAADVADLLRLGVAAQHQRSGLGSALLSAATERARARGCSRMLLEVGRENRAARDMYERLGFEVVATRGRYYADGSDAVVMALDLSVDALDALDEHGDG